MSSVAPLLLALAARHCPPVSFRAEKDVAALGLLASLWAYALAERRRPAPASPFVRLPPRTGGGLPHLVAVQSESFFDPRPLYSGIRRDILAGFDRLKSSALMHGSLSVPAWWANTVRTEFVFLSGLHDEVLGVHRFNPFRAVAGGWEVPSLASFLKSLGYRTVCVHSYPASFYSIPGWASTSSSICAASRARRARRRPVATI